MIVWTDKASVDTINTPSTARARIAAIDIIIDQLLDAAGKAALNANIKEYRLDDGVTKVMFEYGTVKDISIQIRELMALQELYLQMQGMRGRMTRLITTKCMPNYGPWGNGLPIQM